MRLRKRAEASLGGMMHALLGMQLSSTFTGNYATGLYFISIHLYGSFRESALKEAIRQLGRNYDV
jgi:hypothetical protein